MGLLKNALNNLAGNILGSVGGSATGSTTPILRKSAIEMRNESPTDKLRNDPLAFSSVSYPSDLTNDMANGHYMLFYINVRNKTKYRYKDPGGKSVGQTVKTERKGRKSSAAAQSVANRFNSVFVESSVDHKYSADQGSISGTVLDSNNVDLSKGSRGVKSGLSSYHPTTTRISDSIAIYLPPNVQDNLSAAYNGMATGMIGAAAQAGAGAMKDLKNDDFEGAASAIVDGAGAIGTKLAVNAAAGIGEALGGGEGGEELLNKAFGQANNPYLEVLFDQMALRQFTYNFTFAPRSEEETKDVQKIIHMFRFHMAPELQQGEGRFLTLPSEFDIHYMYQAEDGKNSENDYYNRISTCVLENVAVDYTPGGVRSFADGAPTQITMGLTFKETELLTKDRIDEGF
jgi:hypothetical protein|tara:strand:- start:903 stop:2105 length:1203 start_codon:yes stop_codon:yes gene_type:complete